MRGRERRAGGRRRDGRTRQRRRSCERERSFFSKTGVEVANFLSPQIDCPERKKLSISCSKRSRSLSLSFFLPRFTPSERERRLLPARPHREHLAHELKGRQKKKKKPRSSFFFFISSASSPLCIFLQLLLFSRFFSPLLATSFLFFLRRDRNHGPGVAAAQQAAQG